MASYLVSKSQYDCSGCGACAAKCPLQCITLEAQPDGFYYPLVDDTKCIHCHLCETVCPYQNAAALNPPIQIRAATSKNADLVRSSSSGGVFSLLAETVLQDCGTVYGAAFDDEFRCVHVGVKNAETLSRLRKSKYVQSDTATAFREIPKALLQGTTVLFSGTPCQVAGLKALCKGRDDRLITVDIACHGVPSQQDFDRYRAYLEKTQKGTLRSLDFRDKRAGAGHHLSYEIETEDGCVEEYHCKPFRSAYYYLFLHGKNFRKSCYSCPYAQLERAGDLSLADCWGLGEQDVPFAISSGVSAVTINTERGAALWAQIADLLDTAQMDKTLLIQNNQPFRAPCEEPENRDALLERIRTQGYAGSQSFMSKATYLKECAKALIPSDAKTKLKKLIRRGH